MDYQTWVAGIKDARRGRGWTLTKLGKEAAKVVGRTSPFSEATMSRFERGEHRSREVITAMSVLFRSSPPGTPVLEDEDILEWLEIGNGLRSQAPVLFGRELERLGAILRDIQRGSR